jgi:hypothetical protein
MSTQSDGIEFILQMLQDSYLKVESACAPDRLDLFEWSEPRTLYQHKVWRGSLLLHVALYEARSAEEARRDGRHYYAWDRVSKVELVHPDGTVEEIR